MNKEKQKIIADICPFYKEYGSCDRCNTETEIDDPPCYFECMANAIIDNNYRKVIQCKECEYFCEGEFCRAIGCIVKCDDFCSYARMKGGAE